MDKNQVELLNIYTDLRRAILELVDNSSSDIFVQNIMKRLPKLIQIDPNITNYININQLINSSLSPRLKAEHLLMMSLRLQHYLGL